MKLSAHQFQPEFVAEPQTSEQRQMPGLCGGVGAVSWSHPGDRHKRGLAAPPPPEHCHEAGAGDLQQLLAVAAVTRIIPAGAPGHRQSLQGSLLEEHRKPAQVLLLMQSRERICALHSEVAASVTCGSFQAFHVCLLKKLVLLAGRGRI